VGRMKWLSAAVVTSAVVASGLGAVAAGALTVRVPDVTAAAATIQLKAVKVFSPAHCVGAGGQAYVTFRGALAGTEASPVTTTGGYPLTGTVTIKHVIWTVNAVTGRGVFRGQITLVNPASAAATATTYVGVITLITQAPAPTPSTAPRDLPAGVGRGWINADTYTGGKDDGGSLFANVAFTFGPALTATGEFGGTSTTGDLAAITAGVDC
jgi:hypothetical protein